MDADWIKSPTARRILVHWADSRPAWLWSRDGDHLLWRNEAARFFHGRMKKHGVKLAPEAVPIRGQIARLIRLGSVGRSSLSRIQFLAGDRPVSTTCSCTPLELDGADKALLIVGVDPIEPELLEAIDPARPDPLAERLFPAGAEFLLVNDDSQISGGSPRALERYAPHIESEGLPPLPAGDSAEVLLDGVPVVLTRYRASPHEAMLLLIEPVAARQVSGIADIRREDGFEDEPERPPEEPAEQQPLLPLGLEPIAPDPAGATPAEDHWTDPLPQPPEDTRSLSSLFDRLVDDEGLFGTLTEADEHFAGARPADPEPPPVEAEVPEADPEPLVAAADEPAPDMIGALIDFADDEETVLGPSPEPEAAEPTPVAAAPVTTWRVVGRRITPLHAGGSETLDAAAGAPPVEDDSAAEPEPEPEEPPPGMPPDAETVERVSRYNFDELSRILADRVSAAAPPAAANETEPAPVAPEGALINLGGETIILNRLPIGILVFRDQQVQFANRALVDLTGHDSVESLRAAGLTSIFPAEDAAVSGPVTHLVRRDGALLPVNARLQSITWNGRPALMLSASLAESRLGHEGAVRAFAELAAESREEGFLVADRAGVVTAVSLHGRIILGQPETDLVGRPLAALVEADSVADLKAFLERPARFAETSRPATTLKLGAAHAELVLFAQGQAGIVTDYFGFLRRTGYATPAPAAPPVGDDVEPSMLVRISRGVRRPLNTIIGFADMIRSAAFGSIENQRYVEYARDIKTAGEEIATLVDEIDDYARLRDGRYPAEPDEIDLVTLLETCLLRIRAQAGAARVLVRNAISERLPSITADRASLTQAVLNLLASAVDQTPVGGSVILSAQQGDDGSLLVNVRDGSENRTDPGERFVVFRDGVGRDGETLLPVRSSVGLALTRSLLAVNGLSLSVDPTAGVGTLFSLLIPPELTARRA